MQVFPDSLLSAVPMLNARNIVVTRQINLWPLQNILFTWYNCDGDEHALNRAHPNQMTRSLPKCCLSQSLKDI